MILLLDNYDSFTYNLVDYFFRLGVKCDVFRNDHPIDAITAKSYNGVVLSAGPEIPDKAGQLKQIIKYYENKLPMLGICLGHQAIGEFYGAQLVKASRPMHGKMSQITVSNDPIFHNLPKSIDVVRYNSLILEEMPSVLSCIARTHNGEVMAIKHNQLPIWGVQFHPEAALTTHGLEILKNWLVYNHIT